MFMTLFLASASGFSSKFLLPKFKAINAMVTSENSKMKLVTSVE